MRSKNRTKVASKVDPLIQNFNEIIALREAGWKGEPVRLSSGTVLHNPVVKKVITAEKWKDKQVKRAVAAGDEWLEGVKNPSRDPIAAAIAARAKMIDRHAAAMKAGKWKRNLEKSSHAEIVGIVEKLGTGVYTSGVEARDAKIKRVVDEIQPLVQSVSDAIQALPDGTDAEREKRLTSARKLMIEVGAKRLK